MNDNYNIDIYEYILIDTYCDINKSIIKVKLASVTRVKGVALNKICTKDILWKHKRQYMYMLIYFYMDLTENNLCISYKHKKKFFIQRLDHDIPMYFDAKSKSDFQIASSRYNFFSINGT